MGKKLTKSKLENSISLIIEFERAREKGKAGSYRLKEIYKIFKHKDLI